MHVSFQYQAHDEEDVVEVEHLVVRTPVAGRLLNLEALDRSLRRRQSSV